MMSGLMFILVLGFGLVLTVVFPPIGLFILALLVIWVIAAVLKGGAKGALAVFSVARPKGK